MRYNIRKKIDFNAIRVLGTFLVLVISVSAIGYLGNLFSKAQGSFEMATGSYTGNGTSQSITGAGFQPGLAIIKSDTAVGKAVFATSAMPANSTHPFDNGGSITGAVTSLDANGFSVGSNANVNSDTVTYRWIAFGGSGGSNFKVGSYTGDGNDNRSIPGVGFQPNLVWIKDMAQFNGYTNWRSSSMTGDISYYFMDGVSLTNTIQALEADGFQVGSSVNVNTLNNTYYYVAFKVTAGSMAVGTYTGNGNDNDTTLVSGLGFQPQFAWVKNITSTFTPHRSASISTDSTQVFDALANAANLIQNFTSGGLELGNDSKVNASGGTYFYTAFASGAATPVLDSLNPTSGREGDSITLSGSNFGATQDGSTVSFNGTAVTTYTSWSGTEIVGGVPTGATTGNVTVTTGAGTSNGVNFSVYPKITSLSPSSGNIGSTVTITGLNFEASQGSNTVTFNGIAVTSYTSWSATEVVIVAPSSTTGNVVVTTTVGASTGSTFSYYPAISSISPTSGSRSTSVTITGSNFGATRGSSYASFGSGQASDSNYLLWSNDSILVQVPSGASRGDNSVTVTTSVGTSNSQTFNMTVASTTPALVPSIVSVSPVSLDVSGLADTNFTITGSNFDKENGVRVQFYLTGVGWFESKQESVTSTTIKVKFDNLTRAIAGNYHVVVTNVRGGNKSVLEKAFVVSDKTTQVEVPKKEKTIESPTTPSTVDSGAIALITRRLDEVLDLLKSFGQVLSSLGATSALGSTYRYEIDFQSPDLSLVANEVGTVTVSVKNTGTTTWYQNGAYPINLGTSNPLDRASVFATASWFGGATGAGELNRAAAMKEEKVLPSTLATFVVPLKAPSVSGVYVESFQPVAEYLFWLSGPKISWTITVR